MHAGSPDPEEQMAQDTQALAISLFSEVLAADQMIRLRLSRVMPKGMEISHFAVLNHLCWHEEERTPAQLAATFNVTRGAMTNTLSKLEWAGYVHVRPDWDDARRKLVAISPSGRTARDETLTRSNDRLRTALLAECLLQSILWNVKELRPENWVFYTRTSSF